jgi:hypothetical protein
MKEELGRLSARCTIEKIKHNLFGFRIVIHILSLGKEDPYHKFGGIIHRIDIANQRENKISHFDIESLLIIIIHGSYILAIVGTITYAIKEGNQHLYYSTTILRRLASTHPAISDGRIIQL